MSKKYSEVNVSLVIVTYGHEDSIEETLNAVQRDKLSGDKLIIVDNHPEHGCARIARNHAAVDQVIESDNVGFGVACNIATTHFKKTDMYYFLNPDAIPQASFLTEIKKAYVVKPEWDAWMSLLILPNGRVNSAGNMVHVSGLSWVDGYGENQDKYIQPKNINYLSGACFAVRGKAWWEIGGFSDFYFLYYEDTDLSTKLKLCGKKLGLWPASKVVHAYNFQKGSVKWFYLERNRIFYILTNWPLATLLLSIPMLIICEIGLWIISIFQGRLVLRIKAVLSILTHLPTLYLHRRQVQSLRKISSAEFINYLGWELNSPFLGKISEMRWLQRIFKSYLKLLKTII